MLDERLWRCDCGAHVLGISFYTWKDSPLEWFIEVYGMPGRTSLRWRIKEAWNLLLGRDVYLDSVALDSDKATDLMAFMDRNLDALQEAAQRAHTVREGSANVGTGSGAHPGNESAPTSGEAA